jgi:hypothetical protein
MPRRGDQKPAVSGARRDQPRGKHGTGAVVERSPLDLGSCTQRFIDVSQNGHLIIAWAAQDKAKVRVVVHQPERLLEALRLAAQHHQSANCGPVVDRWTLKSCL